jgi:hypothetical protein
MKLVPALLFMKIIMSHAMLYGKILPTHIQVKTSNEPCCLAVKTVSHLEEFAHIVSVVDDARRILELREGIIQAKSKHFTFRCICGPTYVSVFGIK